MYRWFSDIDECKGNHSCCMNAICTNTKGSYVCTCHPGYTENGRGCVGIWCVSFVTIFIRKKSTIIVVRLVLPLYLVLKRDECRLEDNIDDDTIVLNKHSGKKISTDKGRLDGWAHRTEQWIKFAGNQEKNLVSAKVSCLRLGPKKTRLRFLSLCSPTSSRLHFLKFVLKFLRIKGINLDAFLLKPFPSERKALSYLRDFFYQHTLYWPFHS